jgi:hydrogenase maturation protease
MKEHVKPRVVVLGIGNPLCRDDGAGIRVIQELWKKDIPPDIRVMDGGTSPDLPSLIEPGVPKLVIVDALRGGKEPGYIYRLELDESHLSHQPPESLHGLGLLDGLMMMKMLGTQPQKVVLTGIEPADTSHGLGLSPLAESRLPALIEAVVDELRPPY